MEEPPKPLAAAMMNADVPIEYAMQYLLYTKTRIDALNNRNRAYICLTGCDTEGMVRTIGMVNYKKMIELGDKLAELTGKADEIRITSPAGTDFSGKIGGRPVENYGSTADKKKYIMLGGQTGWACLEDSQNGTLAFDGNLWPPDEVSQHKNTHKAESCKGHHKRDIRRHRGRHIQKVDDKFQR